MGIHIHGYPFCFLQMFDPNPLLFDIPELSERAQNRIEKRTGYLRASKGETGRQADTKTIGDVGIYFLVIDAKNGNGLAGSTLLRK